MKSRPEIAFFGAALQHIGFPITLMLTAIISLVGVIMIRKGLSFPIPITEERKQEKLKESMDIDAISSEVDSSDSPKEEWN